MKETTMNNLLNFPNPVYEYAARTVAFMVLVLSINYSYDFNRSELTHISSGSTHEMGIALHLFTRNKSICAGVCPAE